MRNLSEIAGARHREFDRIRAQNTDATGVSPDRARGVVFTRLNESRRRWGRSFPGTETPREDSATARYRFPRFRR